MATDCRFTIKEFDKDGNQIAGSDIYGPASLDWMPLDVKVHWYLFMGRGDPRTKSVLLESQGEKRLLSDVTLRHLDHKEYKEKYNDCHNEIEKFIEEGGYSRVPRNQ